MERHFHEELSELKHLLVKMAGTAEQMIGDAIRMLVHRDESVRDAIAGHEHEVNRMQCELDEQCSKLIALHQPTASDLRFILGCIKTNGEVERLADEAVNISHKAERLLHEPPVTDFIVIPEMAAMAAAMVKDSIHAYVNGNVEEARAVIVRDAAINSLKGKATDRMLALMTSTPAAIPRALDIIMVTRNIERIGDHAKNICENAIYVAEGRDIRHPRDFD